MGYPLKFAFLAPNRQSTPKSAHDPSRRHTIKIDRQVIQNIVGFLCILLLLAPITAQAQTKVVVIPLFEDDPKPLKNIITVAKANGDFTNPVTAVNSITDASAENPYLVVIGPGVYTITQTLQMKPYVDIVGSGENITKITGAIGTSYCNVSSAIISGANNSALSFLAVENAGGGYYSIGLYSNNASPRVSHATVTASGGYYNFGVHNGTSSSPTMSNVSVTASGGNSNYGVSNYFSSPTMNNVTVTASGGSESRGVSNYSSSPTMNNVTVTASGGSHNFGVNNSTSSSPTMSNVSVTASGGSESRGVYNFSLSSPTMNNVTVTASGGSESIGVLDDGSSSSEIRRSTIKGGSYSLYSAAGGNALLSQSTLIGPVYGGTNNECVACDNGSGAALGKDCAIIP